MKSKINIGNVLILSVLVSIIGFLFIDKMHSGHEEILRCLSESSVIYVSEGTNDYWQTVNETESLGTGDCEDMALLLYSKLKRAGYDPELCIGIVDISAKTLHMWVELNYKGHEYILDPTGNLMFERRYAGTFIKFPKYLFQAKLIDWEIRNAKEEKEDRR